MVIDERDVGGPITAPGMLGVLATEYAIASANVSPQAAPETTIDPASIVVNWKGLERGVAARMAEIAARDDKPPRDKRVEWV